MILLFGAQAHGGKLLALDDQSVTKDLAALNGGGGNSYAPYVISGLVQEGGYGTFRRLVQRVPHEGVVTVKVTPWRDGQETGQVITRVLAVGDNPTVVAPLMVTGSVFQFKVELSGFDAPTSLGAGEFTVIPRRTTR